MLTAARILMTAGMDKETAVRMDQSPISEIRVVRGMPQKPDIYDEKVVHAIIDSVSMLFPGSAWNSIQGKRHLLSVRPLIRSGRLF